MYGEFLHACLIAQNTTLGTFRRGVYGQYGQLTAFLVQHMYAKSINTGRLARTRDTADAHADAVTTVGQALVDNLLSLCLVVGIDTLDQRHGLRQDGDIALDNALHHLCSAEFTPTEAVTLHIRVNDGRLFYTAVDLQACIF